MKRYLKRNIRVIRVVGLVFGVICFISIAYHEFEGKIEAKYQNELSSQTWGSKSYGVEVEPLTFGK